MCNTRVLDLGSEKINNKYLWIYLVLQLLLVKIEFQRRDDHFDENVTKSYLPYNALSTKQKVIKLINFDGLILSSNENINNPYKMGKFNLQMKATLEGIKKMYTNYPDYTFLLKLKCTSCGEASGKWHDVCESQTFPGKTGRSENNYIAKCKLCGRENSLDIVPGSNGKVFSR